MDFELSPVIAAVRTEEDFKAAADSPFDIIFLLHTSILTLQGTVAHAHEKGKKVFIHIDFAEGIGKDKLGLEYIARLGVDGIISTRANIVRLARECSLATVQRFFIVDSHSVDTAVESIKSAKPDTIEIMPGILPRTIAKFRARVNMPIIAGGLIETKGDIIGAIKAGASAVSTSKKELWIV